MLPLEPPEAAEGQETRDAEDTPLESPSALVRFFRDRWAPFVIRFRIPLLVIFAIIFGAAVYLATQLEPDDNGPSILPNGNPYKDYPQKLLDWGNQMQL